MIKKMRRRFIRDPSRPNFKPDPRLHATRQSQRYGHIPGVELGATFPSRQACAEAGVHGVIFQGIHGPTTTGAYSVCLSGIYEDDEDNGDSFVYTGTGGKANAFESASEHVVDQSFAHAGNKALKMSVLSKRPVRVVRGPSKNSKWAPTTGYRYDGLYRVVKAYYGRNGGRRVCKFDFRGVDHYTPPSPVASSNDNSEASGSASDAYEGDVNMYTS